jgi:hypothetical protein
LLPRLVGLQTALEDILRFTIGGDDGYAWPATPTGNTYLGLIGTGLGLSHRVRFADMDGDGDDEILKFLDGGDAYAWRSDRSRYTSLGLIGRVSATLPRFVGDRDGDPTSAATPASFDAPRSAGQAELG